MRDPAPSSRRQARAARDKRYRARSGRGLMVVPVEIDGAMLDFLIATHWLAESEAADRAAIGAAIGDLLTDAMRRR